MRNIDIVIAKYKEELEWLNNLNLKKIKRIFIYNKNSEEYALPESCKISLKKIKVRQ